MSTSITASSAQHDQEEIDRILSYYLDFDVSHDKLLQRYSQLSDTYDSHMEILKFNAPKEIAATVCRLFPINRHEVYILDVAAGTGLCGAELQKHGFRKTDAMDACFEMLQKAKQKNLYGQYIHFKLGEDKIPISDDTYDAVTISSMSTPIVRELPMNALTEMIRVVKPGGYVVNTHFAVTFTDNNALRRNTETLEKQGKWTRVEFRQYPEFSNGEDGIISVHEVPEA